MRAESFLSTHFLQMTFLGANTRVKLCAQFMQFFIIYPTQSLSHVIVCSEISFDPTSSALCAVSMLHTNPRILFWILFQWI